MSSLDERPGSLCEDLCKKLQVEHAAELSLVSTIEGIVGAKFS